MAGNELQREVPLRHLEVSVWVWDSPNLGARGKGLLGQHLIVSVRITI